MSQGCAALRLAGRRILTAVGQRSAIRAVGCAVGLPVVGDRSSTASTRLRPSGNGVPCASYVTYSLFPWRAADLRDRRPLPSHLGLLDADLALKSEHATFGTARLDA